MLDVVRMIAPVEFVSCGLEIWIWIEKRYLRELSKANKNRKRPGGVVTSRGWGCCVVLRGQRIPKIINNVGKDIKDVYRNEC